MPHEDFNQELNALREKLPAVVEGTAAKQSDPTQIRYSAETARFIGDFYAQGISLHAISKKAGMPAYTTLLRWAKEHPELSKMLRSVRQARAIHFEDAAIEAAEAASGKDADRIKVDTYKWAAEVNDPATYGKKVTHAGDAANPVVLQVVTGFGPPNPWQTPPKLKADGTIDQESSKPPTQEVRAEVVGGTQQEPRESGRGGESGHPEVIAGGAGESPHAGSGGAPEDRPTDAPGSDGSGLPDGP